MRKEGADEDDTILAIEGTIIKQVTETKFLGLTIDDKLSWKPHIEILNKKLKSLCGRIMVSYGEWLLVTLLVFFNKYYN